MLSFDKRRYSNAHYPSGRAMQVRASFLRWALLLLLLLSCRPVEEPEVYFSPEGGAREAILRRIENAGQRIDVAMYAFTSRELAWALAKARERGVLVRVLLDGEFIQNEYSKDKFLTNRGVEVRVEMSHLTQSGDFQGLMHNKFAIIDEKTAITGSYNWTASAQEQSEENLLIFPESARLARLYTEQFEKLWGRGALSEAKPAEETPAASEGPVLLASDLKGLRNNAGKFARVQGVVYRVGHSERSDTYFLNFGPGRSSFTGVIFKSALERFREEKIDPKNYEGRRIELSGKVIDHPKYGLEIVIEDPDQIELVRAPK